MTYIPNDTGFYLWYILDFSYLKVGAVQIVMDTPAHRAYLQSLPADRQKDFYIYRGGDHELSAVYTMYHQAHDHLPPVDENNRPIVDGYIPFDMRTLNLIPAPPLDLVGTKMRDATPEEVARLIEQARHTEMTPEQREEQRISFAFGNASLGNPDVTRQMVEDAARDLGTT